MTLKSVAISLLKVVGTILFFLAVGISAGYVMMFIFQTDWLHSAFIWYAQHSIVIIASMAFWILIFTILCNDDLPFYIQIPGLYIWCTIGLIIIFCLAKAFPVSGDYNP